MDIADFKAIQGGPGNPHIYQQIQSAITEAIEAGQVRPGERLPAVRELALALGVNPITVSRAYRELAQKGVLSGRGRGGTIVAPTVPTASNVLSAAAAQEPSRRSERIELVSGNRSFQRMVAASDDAGVLSLTKAYPSPEVLWPDGLGALIEKTARRSDSWMLDYTSSAGLKELRSTFAQFLRAQNTPCDADDLILTNGAQQALDLSARALLRAGDVLLMERPTYFGMLDLARSLRLKPIGVELEADGVSLAGLQEALAKNRPRAFYTMPNFQNPTGVTLSLSKRERILELCAAADVPIIEDDHAPEMRFKGPHIPSLCKLSRDRKRGEVFYVRTLSKTYLPGMRIGCVVVPEKYIEEMLVGRGLTDLHQSNLTQALTHTYLASGQWRDAAHTLADHYRERQETLLAALKKHLPAGTEIRPPKGGLNVWVRLPPGFDAGAMLYVAMSNRVSYFIGEVFYPDEPDERTLRLSFGKGSDRDLEEAAKRLGKSVLDHLKTRGSRVSVV